MNARTADFPELGAVGPVPRLSANLTLAEFTATRHVEFLADQRSPPEAALFNARRLAVDLFEPAHNLVGRMHVSSGYRCFGLNEVVGGRPDSAHLEGRAADVEPLDTSRIVAYQRIAESDLPFDELLWEMASGWIHMQVARPGVEPRRLTLMTFDGRLFESFDPSDPRVRA